MYQFIYLNFGCDALKKKKILDKWFYKSKAVKAVFLNALSTLEHHVPITLGWFDYIIFLAFLSFNSKYLLKLYFTHLIASSNKRNVRLNKIL